MPESLKILSRQRERWQRGLIAAMWQYKGMLFNPRYGRVGLLAMPFFAFGEMLAPVIELLGYLITTVGLAFGLVNVSFALLFVLVAWGYGMLLSIWAVVLEEVSFRRYRRFGDLFRLLLFASLENFGYRQLTVWWRLKAFVSVFKGAHVWGDMTRKGFGKASVAALVGLLLATPCLGQRPRINAWGAYESVSGSQAWNNAGAQLTLTTARGHGAWMAVEHYSRFGESDLAERIGAVVHPTPRLWFTAEAGTALRPAFTPRNTWEVDAASLVARHVSGGLGLRRWNYDVGRVDVLMPHLAIETSRMSWTARAFISRPPTKRTDTALSLRFTRSVTPRVTLSLLGAAGRESYFVGGAIASLKIVSGVAGIRYADPHGTTWRFDLTGVNSKPILTRNGVAIGLERAL